MCDDNPRWFGELQLLDYELSSCKLKSIIRNSQEKFFVAKLGTTEWWKILRTFSFKEKLIREFIRRMCKFINMLNANKIKQMPPILVSGDKLGSSVFASKIIVGFLSSNNTSSVYSFSIDEITYGTSRWMSLDSMIMDKNVIIIDIPQLEYTHYAINMIDMLACLIRQNAYNCNFILHGTDENIDMMRKKCKIIDDLFDREATFKLTSNRSIDLYNDEEDEDEFMKLLEDFISSEGDENASEADYLEEPMTESELNYVSLNDDENSSHHELLLKEMIGLERLKKDFEEAKTMAMFNQKRKEFSLCVNGENRYHMLFLGNPGTGKTTVAKLVGKIYHDIGILSKGHTIETNRSKLIGEYIGQTEKHVLDVIEKARGGVLFIDEAYNLVTAEYDKKDFGKEVINTLLTVLSEPNPDMIFIFAGYEEKMKQLMKTNPGLKDRFPLCFYFDDYSVSELMDIARKLLSSMNFILTPAADLKLEEIVNKALKNKDEFFW